MWTSVSLILFDTLVSSPYKPVHRRGGAHFEGALERRGRWSLKTEYGIGRDMLAAF